MPQIVSGYTSLVVAMGSMALLFLLQLLVLDVAGITARHVPGTPVPSDHKLFLFRATRAHANTNESVVVFVMVALFGMFSAAVPAWLSTAAWVYVAARVGHMLCYYLDWRAARSASFAVGLLALWAMLIVSALPWF
jgi:uncharacterized MAPEG superfamily protein